MDTLKRWDKVVALLPALLVGGFLTYRNLGAWDMYSVDVLYRDQWDFWIHMFQKDSGLWEMFNHQHGPHKMGVGYFVLYAVAVASDWNVRTEGLVLIMVSVVTVGVFLWLKWRLYLKWDWSDLILPLLCFSFVHCEIYFFGTNPSLNVVPLLLIALIAVCIGSERSVGKYACLVVLGFFATYTGFGIFAGLLVPVYCAASTIRTLGTADNRGSWWLPGSAAVLSIIGFWSFFWDYRFLPAVADFRFPHEPVWEYGVFVGKYWAYFFNLAWSSFGTWVLGLVTFSVIGVSVWKALTSDGERSRKGRRAEVVAFLCLSGLLFSVNVAVGRISLGLDSGMVSRYLTFLVPLWVGGYLLVLGCEHRIRTIGCVVLVALLANADRSFEDDASDFLRETAEGKRRWVSAYLQTRDIREADEASGFAIYPFEWAYPRLEVLIDQMEEKGVGFARGESRAED